MSDRKAFRITGGKGFHMALPNGYTMSVQFGPGNYCDHYDRGIGREEAKCGSEGSDEAEVAVIAPDAKGELEFAFYPPIQII